MSGLLSPLCKQGGAGVSEKNITMNHSKAIITNQLTKRFGDFIAVDAISFEVEKGEIFGFLGANGAGKTTAMRMLCGLSFPTSGKGMVAGFDVYKENEKIKKSIGYMSQKFSLYEDLTVKENMQLYGGIYGKSNAFIKQKTEAILDELDLKKEANVLVKSLPLGWKQKLAFAVAVFHEPGLVFLDEPTGGVDPVARREFWSMIYNAAAKGVTMFVTTHYMDEAEYCNRVSIMVDGRIEALDTPHQLKQTYNAASMDEVFLKLARKAVRTGD
jgi:ABC-2 type transport system ATP-binding protein